MTIQAQYWVHEPGRQPVERVTEIATREQLDGFIRVLSGEHASDAILTHTQRPRVETLIPDEHESSRFLTMPDHSVICGIHGDRGAMSYQGSDGHTAEPVRVYSHGDGPGESVFYETDAFPAYCEVTVEALTGALEEFLHTAKRPLSIGWQPAPVCDMPG